MEDEGADQITYFGLNLVIAAQGICAFVHSWLFDPNSQLHSNQIKWDTVHE